MVPRGVTGARGRSNGGRPGFSILELLVTMGIITLKPPEGWHPGDSTILMAPTTPPSDRAT